MKSLASLLCAVLLAVGSLTAQTSRSYDFADFTGVSVNAGIYASIEYGTDFSIEITGDSDDLDDLEVEVKDNTLMLSMKSSSSWWNWMKRLDKVEAVVTMPRLDRLTANGGADVRSKHRWESGDFVAKSNGGADLVFSVKAKNLDATSNGGADLTADIEVDYLEASSNGGADLDLSGTAIKASLRANGGADLTAPKLMCERVDASANGGADIVVSVSKAINASANGGADILYYGDPAEKNVSSNGGGDVTRG